MTSPTRRATDGKQAGGQSRGLPQRTPRPTLADEFREFFWVLVLFFVVGVGGYALFLASLMGAIG